MAKIEVDSDRPTYATDYFPHDTDRAVFLGNPVLDNIMTCMTALGSEVWATRRRMYVLEAILQEKGVSEEMIEAYMPSAEQEARWKEDRDRMVEMMFSPMLRNGDLPMSAGWQEEPKK